MGIVHYSLFRLLLVFTGLVLGMSTTAGADTPVVGAPAPDFTLTNNEGQPTKLQEYRGKWVVLYFYPGYFTSGCTLEARNFQQDLTTRALQCSHPWRQCRYGSITQRNSCAKEGLSFKLLSDPEAQVSTQYGSVMDYKGSKLSARNTFPHY